MCKNPYRLSAPEPNIAATAAASNNVAVACLAVSKHVVNATEDTAVGKARVVAVSKVGRQVESSAASLVAKNQAKINKKATRVFEATSS